MKTKPTRQFLFNKDIAYSTIDQLPPEDQARLLNLKPQPKSDARYSTLAPQSRRHIGVINERGKYQQSGGESW